MRLLHKMGLNMLKIQTEKKSIIYKLNFVFFAGSRHRFWHKYGEDRDLKTKVQTDFLPTVNTNLAHNLKL